MKLRIKALAVAVVLAAPAVTQAALITWGTAQNITGDADVSLDGAFVAAANFGTASDAPTTTVNGVTFTSLGGFVPSNADFTFDAIVTQITSTYGGGAAPFSTLTPEYQALLVSRFVGSSYNLTLNGLTLGETYQLQLWSNRPAADTFLTAATGLSSVTLDANTADADGGLGQYVLGSFTADATTQVISMAGSLNGVQLRRLAPAAAVPEPGTALAGVMLAGLVGLRRRRS